MGALSTARHTRKKVGDIIEIPMKAATIIYAGAMVCVNSAAGFAIPAADAANNRFMGVAQETVDNQGGLDGAKKIRVRRDGIHLFNASSITQAMVGVQMYVVDDNTFDETSPGNNVKCGELVEYVSTTQGWLDISQMR